MVEFGFDHDGLISARLYTDDVEPPGASGSRRNLAAYKPSTIL